MCAIVRQKRARTVYSFKDIKLRLLKLPDEGTYGVPKHVGDFVYCSLSAIVTWITIETNGLHCLRHFKRTVLSIVLLFQQDAPLFAELYNTTALYTAEGLGGGDANEGEEKRRLNSYEWNVFAKCTAPFAAAILSLFRASRQAELPRQFVL